LTNFFHILNITIAELKEEDMPMVLALKAKRFERELIFS